MDKAFKEVSESRRTIQELGGGIPEDELQGLMDEMDQKLKRFRQIADLVLLAFFEGKKKDDREANLLKYANLIVSRQEGDCNSIAEATKTGSSTNLVKVVLDT